MEIRLNGESKHVRAGLSIAQLLKELKTPEAVIVEYNGKILPAESWGETMLKPADTLELVRFVGGG